VIGKLDKSVPPRHGLNDLIDQESLCKNGVLPPQWFGPRQQMKADQAKLLG